LTNGAAARHAISSHLSRAQSDHSFFRSPRKNNLEKHQKRNSARSAI
jgi:hypothetical protein